MSENTIICKNSRSPHGERGLKFTFKTTISRYILRRSPHGERGLKLHQGLPLIETSLSLSSRRAWIEIRLEQKLNAVTPVALLTESVD